MFGYTHWLKDVGAGVMKWIQTSVADPMPVSVKDMAVTADSINLDTSDLEAALAAILAKIIAAPATAANQATLNAKDFATQATLAALLAKVIAAPATEAKQDTLNGYLVAPNGVVALTPGTPVTAGRYLLINCTVQGNVRLKFNDATTFDIQVGVGTSQIFGKIIDIVAGSTTATATYGVLA